jgi:uncharacterized protein YukE
MTSPGHYMYSSAQLDDIASIGKQEIEEATTIWRDVISQIQGLFPAGNVDAGLAHVLEERNAKYVREITNYSDALSRQSQAMTNINNLAIDGGARMRKQAAL